MERPVERGAAELRRLACNGDLQQVDLQVCPAFAMSCQQPVLDRAVAVPLQLRAEILPVRRRHHAASEAVPGAVTAVAGGASQARRRGADARCHARRAHALCRPPQVGDPPRWRLVEQLV
eukprot:6214024-Pleurochrysis_carterae.AAC.3